MKSIALVKGQNGDNRDISNHPQKASGYRVVKPDINPTNPTSALNGGKGLAALIQEGAQTVETKVLKQAVRRNIDRFPADFMFEMTKKEFENWRSQFVTSKSDRMGLRYKPMAFTEQGILMH